jgi:hypothetical protein
MSPNHGSYRQSFYFSAMMESPFSSSTESVPSYLFSSSDEIEAQNSQDPLEQQELEDLGLCRDTEPFGEFLRFAWASALPLKRF